MNDIVTIKEVAAYLRINQKTARELLPNFRYRKIGRIYRIQMSSVIEWLRGEAGDTMSPSFVMEGLCGGKYTSGMVTGIYNLTSKIRRANGISHHGQLLCL